ENLAGDGLEVETGPEPAHRSQIERQEVEEQRSLCLGGERDHLALLLFRGFLVDVLQIRGLAAQPGAVIHDLAVDLAGCKIDETQEFPLGRPAAQALQPAGTPTQKNFLGTAGLYTTCP